MTRVKILADSASDLPLEFYEQHDVQLITLSVQLDGKEHRDLLDINPKQIFDAMRNGAAPKTSQASPHNLKEIFTELAKNNQPSVYIAFSSELSGTYQTACMVHDQVKEEFPNFDLTIIDSKCASLGLGLVVQHAVQLNEQGVDKETLVKEIKSKCEHTVHLFTVDDLEYLRRGGRVSRASAFVGGLLNIKPLLNVEDGKLIPIEKHRGRKKVLKRMIELMEERGVDLKNQVIGISHGDDEETVNYVKELITEKFGTTKFYVNMIGAVIGAHAGPGTIAIFFSNIKSE